MTRITWLVLVMVALCLPAFAQDATEKPAEKPTEKQAGEKKQEDAVFGHPGWPKLQNKPEETVVERLDDMEKCVEPHLRGPLIYIAGETIKNNRKVVRQFLVDWAIDKIISRLEGDYSFGVRKVCPEALTKICSTESVNEAVEALKKELAAGRKVSPDKSDLCQGPDDISKALPAQVEKCRKALLKALKEDNKNEVREQCAGFMPALGKEKEIVNALIYALLNDAWSIVRSMAVNSLVRIGDPSCIEALRKALDNDSYSTVRAAAADALVKLGDKDADYAKGLTDGWSTVRIACIRALAEFGIGETIEPLIGRLSDKKEMVREEAAIALGKKGDSSALPALGKAGNDPVETVRESAYLAIAEISKRHESASKQAADILAEKIAQEKVHAPKLAAIKGLLQLKDKRGVDVLIESLGEKYEFRVLSAIRLGTEEKVKDQGFLDALLKLAGSEKTSPMVKKAAESAHKELTQ